MSKQPFHVLAEAIINKQISLTTELTDLLAREYETLKTLEADELEQISQDKQPVILEINSLNQHWLTLVSQTIQNPDSEKIATYLKDYDLDQNTKVSELWNRLLTLVKACNKQNEINGTIITLRNQTTQQALGIIRGQAPGDVLYGPRGNAKPNVGMGQTFAKA